MKIAVAGHSILLDMTNEWSVVQGWDDESLQETHGLYLCSIEHGIQLHVRAQGKGSYPLSTETAESGGVSAAARVAEFGPVMKLEFVA